MLTRREEITRLGFQTTRDNTPVIPMILPSPDEAKNLSLFLEENGMVVPFMNYPSAQELHMLRITVTACHTADQTEALLEMLKKWIKKNEKE